MAKKYTADTFEGAVTGTASGNVAKTGDTMSGDLELGNGSNLILSQNAFPYGRIKFAAVGAASSRPYEIVGQSNPGTSSLALRGSQSGTMTDSFVVKNLSGSVYNYAPKPIRIGADAAANELDDYEEGTFNFQFRISTTNYDFNSTNFQGASGNFHNYSRYVKVGRKVTLYFDIRWSTVPWGSLSDTYQIYILGLPFTLSTGSSTSPAGVGGTYSFGSNPTLSSSADAAESGAVSGRFYHPNGGVVSLTRNYYNVGFYNAWNSGSILKGDWPNNDPSYMQTFKGMLTYYTTD